MNLIHQSTLLKLGSKLKISGAALFALTQSMKRQRALFTCISQEEGTSKRVNYDQDDCDRHVDLDEDDFSRISFTPCTMTFNLSGWEQEGADSEVA